MVVFTPATARPFPRSCGPFFGAQLRKIAWFLLIITLSIPGKGQQLDLSGTLVDAYDGKPIASAHVVLAKKADSTIVGFATTTTSGWFQLKKELPQLQDYFLKITCLGYAEKVIRALKAGTDSVRIALEPQQLELPEVVVASERPVRQQGDTIAFKADHFNQMAEQNLEDLFKNLPYFKVDEAGDIYFKNQRVNKVLIEGDNLAGDRYQLLTRTLDPSVLKEIQVVENSAENPLLAGLGGTQETIVNLTIKEERKKRWFGNAQLKGGNRYDGLGNLISLYRQHKQLLVVASNNAGFERSDLNEHQSGNANSATTQVGAVPAPSFHHLGRFFVRNLGSNTENINHEQALRYNWTAPIRDNLKINLGLQAAQDVNRNLLQTSTNFFLGDGFSFFQADTLARQPQRAAVNLDLDYRPSANGHLLFRQRSATQADWLGQHSLFAIGEEGLKSFEQTYRLQRNQIWNQLRFTRKVSLNQAWQVELSQDWSRHQDQFRTDNLAQELWNLARATPQAPGSFFEQALHQERQRWEAKLNWYYTQRNFKFESGLYGRSMSTRYDATLGVAGGTLRVQHHGVTLQQVASWRFKKLETRLSLDWALEAQGLRGVNQRRSLLLPTLMMAYQLPGTGKRIQTIAAVLTTNYRGNYDFALVDFPLMQDFRTGQIGQNAGLLLDRSLAYSLSYFHFDLFRYLSLQVNLFGERSARWDFADYLLQPEFSYAALLNLPELGNWGGRIDVDKALHFLQGHLKLEWMTTLNRFQNRVNQEERDIYGWVNAISGQYRSQLDFPLNLECGYALRHHRYRFVSAGGPGEENAFFDQKWNTTLLVKQGKFSGRLQASWIAIAGNRLNLLGGRVDYTLHQGLKLSLDGYNALNAQHFQMVNLNPLSRIAAAQQLLGRMVLVGLRWGG